MELLCLYYILYNSFIELIVAHVFPSLRSCSSTDQTCPRPVPGPNMKLKGNFVLEKFPDETEVSFSCDTGYTPASGSPVITCSVGSWSPVTLTCESEYEYDHSSPFSQTLMLWYHMLRLKVENGLFILCLIPFF